MRAYVWLYLRLRLVCANVSIDAFGNALGNSIVRAGQASADKREYNDNVEKAIQNGAKRQDATRQELERRGVVFNDNGQPATGGGSSGGTFISGAFDESGDLQLNRYIGGVKQHELATALFSNIAGSDLVGLRDIHNSLLDFAGRDLSSNLGLLNVTRNFYGARVEQQAYESSLLSKDQYYRNRRYSIGNANAQYQQAKFETSVRGNGRVIDLDDATRASVAYGIAQRDKQQLTNIALGIVSLPTLFLGGGFLAVGAVVIRATADVIGKRALIGGGFGASATIAATYVFKPTADFGDYAQAGVIGFVGGAIAGRFAGYGAAVGGGISAEVMNQITSGSFEPTKFLVAASTGVLGNAVSNGIPTQTITNKFDDLLTIGIGRGIDGSSRNANDSTLGSVSSGLGYGTDFIKSHVTVVGGNAFSDKTNGLINDYRGINTNVRPLDESTEQMLYRLRFSN